MKLYIKNIILYPKDRDLTPKIITFKEDKINVITGYSQRGKSAIIDIIDYCLGSSECNIPVGTIRDTVEVFALYLKFNDEFIFLGRENFEESKSTMYFFKEDKQGENKSLRSNEWLNSKYLYKQNTKFIKKTLNEFAGFKYISSKEDSVSGFDLPASFRDTAAFQFQTQNIIANPMTMFYKTDSWEHLQKLKTIFPLILGYKSFDILELESIISDLDNKRKSKSLRIDEIKKQYESWQSDIYEYYSEAINLGLTNSDIDINISTVSVISNDLSNIIKKSKEGLLYKLGSANRFAVKTKEWNDNRIVLLRELDKLKNTLFKIDSFSDSKESYISDVALEKENRLKPIEWFLTKKGSNTCPFCDSESTKAIDELLSLYDIKSENQKILDGAKSIEFSFDNERKTVVKDIEIREKAIEKVDRNLKIISDDIDNSEKSFQKTFEFIGKIEHALENLKKISPSGSLEDELEELVDELKKKRKKLKELESKFDKSFSLSKLSKLIGKYIKIMPIEKRETKIVHLDPDQSLSIKVEDTIAKDKYFLSRLGSGANYMGYHISTLLGLHEFFSKLKESSKPNYVPSFLVFDQPSQVYYPEKFVPKVGEKGSKDIEDTKKIFEACSAFMKNTNYETQLIILEHVPRSTWENINDDVFYLSEEWRGEEGGDDYEALIPKEWL